MGTFTSTSTSTDTTDIMAWITTNATLPSPTYDAVTVMHDSHFVMFGGSLGDTLYVGSQTTAGDANTTAISWNNVSFGEQTGLNISGLYCFHQCHTVDLPNLYFMNVPDGLRYFDYSYSDYYYDRYISNCTAPLFLNEIINMTDLVIRTEDTGTTTTTGTPATTATSTHNLTAFYYNATYAASHPEGCFYSEPLTRPCVTADANRFESTQTVFVVMGTRILIYNVSARTGYFSSDSFTSRYAIATDCGDDDSCTLAYETVPHSLEEPACSVDLDGNLWVADYASFSTQLWRYSVQDDELTDVRSHYVQDVDAPNGRSCTGSKDSRIKPVLGPDVECWADNGTKIDTALPHFFTTTGTYTGTTYFESPRMMTLDDGYILVTTNDRDFWLLPNTSASAAETRTPYIDIVCAGRRRSELWYRNMPIKSGTGTSSVWSLGGFRYVDGDFDLNVSSEVRSYDWKADFVVTITWTESVLFGDNLYPQVYIEPACPDLRFYDDGYNASASALNPFIVEVQIAAVDEAIDIDIFGFMYIVNATAISDDDDDDVAVVNDYIETYQVCYLCEFAISEFPSFEAWVVAEDEIPEFAIESGCGFCPHAVSLAGFSEDEAGFPHEIEFQIKRTTAPDLFTLASSSRTVTVQACDPGFGTTEGAAALDCNVCPFNHFSFVPSLDPCISCRDVSQDDLLCSGGNQTELAYNMWIAAYDYHHDELKPFYEIEQYQNESLKDDKIVTVLCPPNYCCQSVRGCDYYSNYLLISEFKNSYFWDTTGNGHGNLCARGRDVHVPLCGKCLDGWAELLGSAQCADCWDDWYWDGPMIFIISFLLSMLVSNFILYIDSSPPDYSSKLGTKAIMLQDDINGFQTMLFKPVLYYFQTLNLILNTRGIELWLSPVLDFFNLSFDTVGGEDSKICWSWNLDATGEILLNAMVSTLLLVHVILPRFCMNNQGKGSCCCICLKDKTICCCCPQESRTPHFASAFFQVLLITIGVMLTVCFKYVTFVEIADKKLLFYSADKEAFGGWWFGGFFGILMILAAFGVLFYLIKKQAPDSRNSSSSIYRKFVKSFKSEYWYWEFVLFSRRFFVALFLAAQFVGGDYSNFIFIIILVLYLCLQVRLQPFAHKRVNLVETLCMLLLIAAFISANFVRTDDGDVFVGAILTICIAVPLIILAVNLTKIIYRRFKMRSYDETKDEHRDRKLGKMMNRTPKSFRDVARATADANALKTTVALSEETDKNQASAVEMADQQEAQTNEHAEPDMEPVEQEVPTEVQAAAVSTE